MSGGTIEAPKKCGLTELLLFLAAIVAGTACSICSKTMMKLHGIGMDGDVEVFEKPIFQTFGMFVGMCFGLVMHWACVCFKIPFPGYEHDDENASANGSETNGEVSFLSTSSASYAKYGAVQGDEEKQKFLAHKRQQQSIPSSVVEEGGAAEPSSESANTNGTGGGDAYKGTPAWIYCFLAVPAIFDLGATALCMMGLRYLDVSIYQLLRGSGIIFVALMKQYVFGDRLYRFQWIGVFWNVISVFLVGATAMLNNSAEHVEADPGEALLGVILVMVGAFVQALQFVFEEKVMAMDESAVPPLLLIGMEGFWGTFLCLTVVYPLVYYLPGDDHGSYEDPFTTYAMFVNSRTIQMSFVVYFFAIFGYNMFAVLVTYMLNSVWHAILDNFRPITVWCTDLFIFYVITTAGDFGEPWTKYSWIQAAGMFVLLYGTSVYNAPNAGSVKLQGEWFSFGINLQGEYEAIDKEREEAEAEMEWEERRQNFAIRRPSSLAERAPLASIHTQALRGLASPKI